MAREIKETPVLSGKDAKVFARAIKANASKKVPSDQYERAMATYKRVTSSSNLE